MIHKVKDNDSRARILVILLIVSVIINAANAGSLTFVNGTMEGYEPAAVLLIAGGILFDFLILIVTGIVFMMWMWRAYNNLEHAGFKNFRNARSWIIWGWIIPIASLWIPSQLMGDIYRGTQSLLSVVKTGQQTLRYKTPFLALWWIFWIISILFDNIQFRIGEFNSTPSITAQILGNIASACAGVFAIFVIRNISRDEREYLHLIRTNQAVIIPGMPAEAAVVSPELAAQPAVDNPFGETKFDTVNEGKDGQDK